MLRIYFIFLLTENDIGRNFDTEVGKSILINHTKYYVYFTPSFKSFLQQEMVQNARSTDNSRIRYVFDLMSKYFEFVWPKYLKSFENIYNFVASERSQEKIDLSMLIAKLEYGTTVNHEIILRDSGLPSEIIRKISKYFKECENFEEILKIRNTKRKKINSNVLPIEVKIIDKYI